MSRGPVPRAIYAVTSSPDGGGIATVELVGSGLRAMVAPLLGGREPPGARDELGFARLLGDDRSGPIDEAILRWAPGAGGGADEERLWIHVHGGRAVTQRLAAELAALGAVQTEPGALVAAAARGAGHPPRASWCESLLPGANGLGGLAVLLEQAGGAIERWVAPLLGDGDGDAAARARLRREASLVAARQRLGRAALRRPQVVLVGAVNAGKSSLANLLAGRERVLESEEPGTTRDVVLVRLDLEGFGVDLLDTAGRRDAAGPAENEGQRLAQRAASTSDLVVLVVDGRLPAPRSAGAPIAVRTFADHPDFLRDEGGDATMVSSRSGAGADVLRARLAGALGLSPRGRGDPVPLSQREVDLLDQIAADSSDATDALRSLLEARGAGA